MVILPGCSSILFVGQKSSKIQVISSAEAINCEKLQEVKVKVVARLGKINRDPAKFKVEAQNKALNKAAEINATAISPLSEVSKEGNQTFAAYHCP